MKTLIESENEIVIVDDGGLVNRLPYDTGALGFMLDLEESNQDDVEDEDEI